MKFNFINLLAVAALAAGCTEAVVSQDTDFTITDGWKIQSSEIVGLDGEALSTKGAGEAAWYETTVPSTVLGTLTEHGLYADAFIGTNYDKVIDRDDFKEPWWYINEFNVPALKDGQRICLDFEGICYSAEVWLNGILVASREDMTGPYRQFSFDVTDLIKENNLMAVKLFRAEDGDFNIGFVDWNPRAADESMGIFRPIWVRYSDAVSLYNTAVKTKVDTKTLKRAWLTVETTLKNASDAPVEGELTYTMEGKTYRHPVTVGAGEEKVITVGSDDAAMFDVKNPRLWWCHNLGTPEMYAMEVSFNVNGKQSDSENVDFGIREIDTYMTEEGHRGFLLNGKVVKLKGVNMHQDHAGVGSGIPDGLQEWRLLQLKKFGCNAYRSSHNPMTPALLDICDRLGILVIEENRLTGVNKEHTELLGRMIRRDRNHPSVILWSVGNEEWGIEWNDFGRRIAESMREYCHRFDPTRLMTVASTLRRMTAPPGPICPVIPSCP